MSNTMQIMNTKKRVKLVEKASDYLGQCIEILELAVEGLDKEEFYNDLVVKPLRDMLDGRGISLVSLYNTIAFENKKHHVELDDFIENKIKDVQPIR